MNTLRSIMMYIYIFGPSARGVNTVSSKEWYTKLYENRKKDKKHGFLKKERAYIAGYLPGFLDKFSLRELRAKDYITERDYLYIQPVNGLYKKWLRFYDVAIQIFYPYEKYFLKEGERADSVERDAVLHILMTNEDSVHPRVAEVTGETADGKELKSFGRIACMDEIRSTLISMCRFAPQLEMWGCDIAVKGDTFKFTDFCNYPEFPQDRLMSEETNRFLTGKRDKSRQDQHDIRKLAANAKERIKLKSRLLFTQAFYPKDLTSYLSIRWIEEVLNDLKENKDADLKTKIWAYKHGFLSYRLAQYGITKENWKDYISDFEYHWLRHINGDAKSLFQDKITIKYVLHDFHDCFPEYYYHIRTTDSGNVIVPMMDCPEGYGDTYDDILRLAREKGVLALKPDEGSHGNGFYRLKYEDGKYWLSFNEATEQDIIDILSDRNNQYLVTEYINNHPEFKRIYDGAVNTIRMVVFKDTAGKAHIGTAYMRFGSDLTHGVDNMGAGGIAVSVNEETGEYGNARYITHNNIKKIDVHPDTGVPITGVIPHWEQIKEKILEIADSVDGMEYFGFDVAVTEDGIKLPEINRFPDYPKMECMTRQHINYLLRKVEEKKVKCGYDKKPCRKLVHLPKR